MPGMAGEDPWDQGENDVLVPDPPQFRALTTSLWEWKDSILVGISIYFFKPAGLGSPPEGPNSSKVCSANFCMCAVIATAAFSFFSATPLLVNLQPFTVIMFIYRARSCVLH